MSWFLAIAFLLVALQSSWAQRPEPPRPGRPGVGNPILVDEHGAAGDGMIYDDAAFAAAEAVAAEKCGVVQLGHGKSYHLAGHTIPPCVTIQGNWTHPGEAVAKAATWAGVDSLYIDGSSATGLVLSSSSTLKNLVIQRYGLSYPVVDASGFAGTAISCLTTNQPRDYGADQIMVLGFAQLFLCRSGDRAHFTGIYGDNLAGIHSISSFDSAVYRDIHLWPYLTFFYSAYPAAGGAPTITSATAAAGNCTVTFKASATIPVGHMVQVTGNRIGAYNGNPIVTASSPGSVTYPCKANEAGSATGNIVDKNAAFYRSGKGFWLEGQQDGTFVDEVYAGGYQTDFQFGGFAVPTRTTGNMQIGRIWADALAPIPGQLGVAFVNKVGRTMIDAINTNSGDNGHGGAALSLNLAPGPDIYESIAIGQLFTSAPYPGGRCISAIHGYASIGKWDAAGCSSWALVFGSAAAHLSIGAATLTASNGGAGTTIPLIAMCAGCTSDQLVFAVPPNTDQAPGAPLVGGSPTGWKRLNSAAVVSAPFGTDEFEVAGNTTVTQILGVYPGRELWLFTSSGAVIQHGRNICLQNNANFQATNGNIRLKYDAVGACWREISRAPLNPGAVAGNALPSLGTPVGCSISAPSGPVSASTFTLSSAATSCAFHLTTPFPNSMVCTVQPTTKGCPLAYPNATKATLAVTFDSQAARGCSYAVVCNGW